MNLACMDMICINTFNSLLTVKGGHVELVLPYFSHLLRLPQGGQSELVPSVAASEGVYSKCRRDVPTQEVGDGFDTLHGYCSLRCLVTPIFLLIDQFLYLMKKTKCFCTTVSLPMVEKISSKSNWTQLLHKATITQFCKLELISETSEATPNLFFHFWHKVLII